MEIVAQILGIVAIVVSVFSMLLKNKTHILLLSILYNILTIVTYLLLGKYLGCILVGVLTLKGLVYFIFAQKKLKPNIFVFITFEVAILVTSIFLWQSWADIFILLNSLINTFTTWQDNVKVLKIGAVICSVFLVLYDVFVGAYVYVISEVLYGGAALVSILWKKKDNKQEISIEEQKDEVKEESKLEENTKV